MDSIQIVILTLLGGVALVTFMSLLTRMANLDDQLWIEVTILVTLALFAYLVAR